MKPSEDLAINDNKDTGKKPEGRKLLPGRQKKRLKKRTTGPSPKKHIAGKDGAADIPRTLNKDDVAKDPAGTEVNMDKTTARASTKNNVPGKAAATDISNTTPSKQNSVIDPSTVAPNIANMPPFINVSGKNVVITNLPAIASPSASTSTTLTNQQNSRHGLTGDKIVSVYVGYQTNKFPLPVTPLTVQVLVFVLDEKIVQNVYYCGYDCNTMVNNVLEFGPNGKVLFCAINYPGS